MRLRAINNKRLKNNNKIWIVRLLLFFRVFISVLSFSAYADINQPVTSAKPGSSNSVPCLVIKHIELINIDIFPNARRLIQWVKQSQGHCLDKKGLSSLRERLQWQLVADGYITSHVTFTENSYMDGTLYLTLIPGRLSSIEHHEDSHGYARLNMVFPIRQGDLINLRNLEQGLDNLQRLPSVSATMDVVLNREDLSSQVVVKRQQSRFWRINTFLDNAGNYTFGRYRAGATLFFDNLLSLSELTYFSAISEIDNHPDKGNSHFVLHSSVPFGYWLLSLTGSQGSYYQSLLVGDTAFKYQTRWRTLDMQIQRLLARGYNYKTIGYLGTIIRKSNRFFADIELEIQRGDTVDWQLGLQHLYYTHWANVGGGINYQQGVSWSGARPSPGSDNFSLSRLINITASLDIPFMLGQQRFHYQPIFNQQYTHSNLPTQDHFSIGGRHSVRGFSSGNVLTGVQGWFFKNDVVWINQRLANQLYVGLDYGEVRKKGGQSLSGKRLVGGVLGVRGRYYKFGYDFNIGLPLDKPGGLNTDPMVLGFMVNWQY